MKGVLLLRLVAGTLVFLTSAGAFGDSGDLLALSVGVSKKHDENLFKRPGGGSLGNLDSDTSTSTQVGLSLNKQYSLQRISINFGLTDNRYQTFKALDGRNENHSASWQWQFTPHLTGNLSATRSQAQSDFADFRGSGQNIRTTDTRRLDGNWLLASGWSLGIGASNTKSSNSQTFLQDVGSEQRILDATLAYKFRSGSSITLLTSGSRGDQDRAVDPLTLSDNRFRERSRNLKFNWPITGRTTVSGGLGQVSRIQGSLGARNFTGTNRDGSLSWQATTKTQVTFTNSRSIESWEEANSSFSTRNQTGLSASWMVTPKVSLTASLNQTRRSFGGEIAGQPANSRLDRSQTRSVGINWTPHTKIKLGASISDDRRESTLINTDYYSKTIMATGSMEF
jgi:exopolysaccharide biosynthesis operon protein EpsL